MTHETDADQGSLAIDLASYELVQLFIFFISILQVKTWQYLGLRLIPGKEKTEKNLEKAALAIDCVDVMIEKATPLLDGDEVKKLKYMLADLQINYTRQV